MKLERSNKLFELLHELEARKIFFRLERQRPDSIMVVCTMVGLRLEIDVFEDGHIEYSIFKGDEAVFDNQNELMILLDHG